MKCVRCKIDKPLVNFTSECSKCRLIRTTRHGIKKSKIRYERMVEYREKNKHSQDDLWEMFIGSEVGNDLWSFTNSEELENLMEKYQSALILKLSGVEDSMPEWMDPEEEL